MIEPGSIWHYGGEGKLPGNPDHYMMVKVEELYPQKGGYWVKYHWIDTPNVAYRTSERIFLLCFHQPDSLPKNFFSRIVSRVQQFCSTALTSFSGKRGKPKGF